MDIKEFLETKNGEVDALDASRGIIRAGLLSIAIWAVIGVIVWKLTC